MLHAQEGIPEPPPGMSWGSPPVQGNWEPTEETLHKTVLKAVRKTRKLTPMLRF